MARSGAKKKFKGTTPGRLNVRNVADDRQAALQPHRRDLPEAKQLAPEATTLIGQLYLLGFLTKDQYVALDKYRGVVAQYCSSIGVPMNGADTSGKGYRCLGEIRCHPCECRRRKERYNEAFEALSNISQKVAKEVAHVAVHDKPLSSLRYLKSGADALVKLFGIDTQGIVVNKRNVR